ncbi:unnamed protein product, partial [marine sediment metagenome]
QAIHFTDLYIPKYDCYAIGLEIRKGNKYATHKTAPCFDLRPTEDSGEDKIIREQIKKAKRSTSKD